MIPDPRIYISASKDQYLDPSQKAIKDAMFGRVEAAGLETWGFFKRGPLRKGWGFKEANAAMSRCQGALVLAFAQWECEGLGGRRQSGLMPSEGNHFEGGLAIAHGVPLLVIREEGSLSRGILSEGPDHQVVDMPHGARPEWLDDDSTFRDHFRSWTEEVKSRPRVFLGYCSEAKAVADEITMFLERRHKVGVRNYAMDFVPGPTILEEVARSVRECSCGIFLFTRSDQITAADEARAAPRDNVIFEAGYFTHAKGKERTVIIREQGVKMPTDLGGNIYISLESRKDISRIHTP
jgi:predicted nucleotide-binding protein with TIR-like domain